MLKKFRCVQIVRGRNTAAVKHLELYVLVTKKKISNGFPYRQRTESRRKRMFLHLVVVLVLLSIITLYSICLDLFTLHAPPANESRLSSFINIIPSDNLETNK